MENENEKIIENNVEPIENKQGWSWMGFLFAPFYYAGYGKIKKGFVLLLLQMLPFVGLGVMIYAGLKARKELPIGISLFSWGGVWKMIGISTAIFVAFGFAIFMAISSFMNSTPKCGDEEVQVKLYEIIRTETAKNFELNQMGVLSDTVWDALKLKLTLTDFRTTSHNDEIDSYECSANMNMEGVKTPFTYSVSKLDNGELYVESKDIIADQAPTTTIPPEPLANDTNPTQGNVTLQGTIVTTNDAAGGGYGIQTQKGVYGLCYFWDNEIIVKQLASFETSGTQVQVNAVLTDEWNADCNTVSVTN